jgi:isopropylmalate/homocitrate/citramalate synthase
MKDNIIILDTSLRDGSHLNGGKFGEMMILDTINGLCKAGLDYIELGFLTTNPYDRNISLFGNISDARKVLPKEQGDTRFALMAYRFDVDNIENYDGGNIDLIRTTFHVYDFEEGIDNCKKTKQKGYKCSVNLINFYGAYTEEQKIENFKRINDIHPFAISMADTYGLLDLSEIEYIYELADKYLDKEIVLGIHLHENKGISYAMAHRFLQIKDDRTVLIDSTLYGIGEVPGNLRLEQICEFMNKYHGTNYDMDIIYKLIDEYFIDLKKLKDWDYELPYAISSKYGINRKYAQFMIEKGDLGMYDINQLLKNVHGIDKASYNKTLAENLYREYKSETNK